MKKIFIIIPIFCFIFFKIVFALEFNITSVPTTLNASTQDQLLNFTVNNTGTTNITYLKIDIPQSFNLVGNPGSTTSASIVQDPNKKWVYWNASVLVENGTVEYFWIHVDVPNQIGYFNFTFTLNDTEKNTSQRNVSIRVVDVEAPKIISESIQPVNNSRYSPNENYTFSIQVSDNVAIDKVILNFNSKNYTAQLNEGKWQVVLSPLGAGTYEYYWIVNDTSNNVNQTSKRNYTVIKALNPVTIWLNSKANQNIILEKNSTLNITVVSKGNISVKQNDTPIGPTSAIDRYEYSTLLSDVGLYIYNATASGNANYTTNSTGVSYTVKVIYHRPRYKSVTTPSSHTYSPGASYNFKITFYSSDAPENNITNVSFTWQGVAHYLGVTNNSYATYSYTVKDLAAGSYSWKWCANDTQSEGNCTSGSFIVNKANPGLKLYGIGTFAAPKNISVVGFNCPSQLTCKLYKNGTELSKNYYDATATGPEYIIFVYNTTGNANYTSDSITGVVTVASALGKSQITNVSGKNINKTNVIVNKTKGTVNKPSQPILNETKIFPIIESSKPVVFNISNPSLFKVETVQIKTKKKLTNVRVSLTPSGIPKGVEPPITTDKGRVYTYLQISTSASDQDISQVTINFQVSKNWIEANNLDKNSIALYRLSGKWIKLQTKKIDEDKNYVHYQAVSPGLSYYAIVGMTAKPISWDWVWIVIVIIVAIVIAYLFWPTETGKQYEYLKRKWSKPFHLKSSL